jgi:hypothetical protein
LVQSAHQCLDAGLELSDFLPVGGREFLEPADLLA